MGLIGFQAAFRNSESVGVSEDFEADMLSLVNSLTRLQPILNDKDFPVRLESLPCVLQLIDSGLGHDLSERFSKTDVNQLKEHIAFLRESTLHLFCKSFGSRAATLYFEALSKGDDYIFVKALFMMSLGLLTQDQWTQSLKALIRSDYYRPSVQNEDGSFTTYERSFLDNMMNYIEAALKALMGSGTIDHAALLDAVLRPDYDSESEDEISSEDSGTESE